jgi:branched-chain amino acid transport system substrate-binding protein
VSTGEDDVLRKGALGVLAAALLLSAGCTSSGDGSDTSELVVAASLELTGSAADIGVAHERGLRLKLDQLNTSGVLGRRKLRLIVSDNQSNPSLTADHVARYSTDPAVSVIITGSCSDCVVEAAQVVNTKGVPLISLAPATQVTTPAESRRFVFKIGSNAGDTARTLVGEMSRAGVRTLGVITPRDAYGTDGFEVMNREAAKANIAVNGSGQFQPGAADLRDAARSASAGKPDAVAVWAFPVQAGQAAAALRESGYTGRLYFDSGAAGNLFLSGPAAAADGGWLVFPQTLAMDDVIATTPAKATRKRWFEDYTSRYGSYHAQSSFAADALGLVVAATGRAGGTDRAALRGVLESMETDGLSGPIRLTPANHSGLMPQALTVLVAKGGRWRLLG